MAKKRKRVKYVSKGERRNCADKVKPSAADKLFNKLNARLRGKKVWDTIPNPNKQETNKRFIRVKV